MNAPAACVIAAALLAGPAGAWAQHEFLPPDGIYDPPLKQTRSGISPENVRCNEGRELVIRTGGDPACVKPGTAAVMKARGTASDPPPSQSAGEIWYEPSPAAAAPGEAGVRAETAGVRTVPASGSVLNVYVTDHDLNLAHRGVETVDTAGLLEFSIGGVPIPGPGTMTETGPDTGEFLVRLEVPSEVAGRPVGQGDAVLVRYADASDRSGSPAVGTESVSLSSSPASIEASGGGSRIGHAFTLRVVEPDADRDSRDVDRIPLGALEFHSEGGIRAPLSDPAFDARSAFLLETGPGTGVFEAEVKIPRTVGGRTVHIGDWYEITYVDRSSPSGQDEDVVFRGRIG